MDIIRIISILLVIVVTLFETSLAQRLIMPPIERCSPGANTGVKGGFRAKGGCESNRGDRQPGIKRPIGNYENIQGLGNRQPGIKRPIENYGNNQVFGNRQPGMRRPIEDYGDNQGLGNRQPGVRRPIEDYGDNLGLGNRQPGMGRLIEDYGGNQGYRQPGLKSPTENYGNNPGQQPGNRRPIGDYDATAGCGVKGGCSAKGSYGDDRRTYRGPEDYGRKNQQDRGVYSNIEEQYEK